MFKCYMLLWRTELLEEICATLIFIKGCWGEGVLNRHCSPAKIIQKIKINIFYFRQIWDLCSLQVEIFEFRGREQLAMLPVKF